MADAAFASPLDVATDWYLALRERELAAQGQAVSAAALGEQMRLMLPPGESASSGPPMTLGLTSRLSDCHVRLNALDGRLISWYIDAFAKGGTEGMAPDAALKLATSVALPPDDAVLEASGYETMADRCFFRARWKHVSNGLPVEDDYIEVLVNGKFGKAFAFSRSWHDVRLGQGPRDR